MCKDKDLNRIVDYCYDESKFQFSEDVSSDAFGQKCAAITAGIVNKAVKDGHLKDSWKRYVEIKLETGAVDPADMYSPEYWASMFASYSTGFAAGVGDVVFNLYSGKLNL